MEKHWRWIQHNGHEILVHDYSGLGPSEAIEALTYNSKMAAAFGRAEMKLLVVVHDLMTNKELVRVWRRRVMANRGLYARIAVVGLTGLAATLLWAFNTFSRTGAKPFNEETAAKDWLTAE